jgi:hypothetical protein
MHPKKTSCLKRMTGPPLFAPLPFELLDLSLIDDNDLIERVHALTLEANS